MKEAACAAAGSAAGVLGAPLPDRDALWAAARAGDADAAWTATAAMGLDGKAGAAAAVPLRLFVVFNGGGGGGSSVRVAAAAPPPRTAYTSRPVTAAGKTLGQALLECLPQLPPGGGGDDDIAASASPPAQWSLTADGAGLALLGVPASAVLTAGVPAPLAAPAAWAHAALAACDRFLYVVVRV